MSCSNRQSGMFTFDPGFTCTGSCESKITFIDGGEGLLQYRGYAIESIANQCDYVEVCYLLMFGELPSHLQKLSFQKTIHKEMMVHEKLISFFGGFKSDAHPMAIMVMTSEHAPHSIIQFLYLFSEHLLTDVYVICML